MGRKAPGFKKVAIARKIYLNGRQRKTLLEKCEGSFRDLVEAGLLTGARYGEFRQLKVSCFDKARRQLSILKGKTGERDVPLSDAAARLFGKLSKGRLPDEFLLTREDGQAWQHSDQDDLMRAAVKDAKLPRKTVFYSLRHTFIANAIEGGIDLVTIGKIAGTSVRMIELHYAKLLRGKAQTKLNRIDFS
jgi:integrase